MLVLPGLEEEEKALGSHGRELLFLQNPNLDPHQNVQEDREKEEVTRGRLGKKRVFIFAQAAQRS